MLMVSPSILAADFAYLAQNCEKVVSQENPYLHFDVMDGVYVPNISVGPPVLASLKKALPNAIYDVHLMIQDPMKYVASFARAGANWITFHLEASKDQTLQTLAAVRAAGCKAGLSIHPGTNVASLFPFLSQLDLVLIMSVEPGFGGQHFMPAAVPRIKQLCAEISNQGLSEQIKIEVDGGITKETADLCVQAGADILVAGSYIFNSADPAAAVSSLRSLAKN